jgi:tRNA-splicing ligase RtcB
MYKDTIKKISENEYKIPVTGKMNVPGIVFVSEMLLKNVDENCLKQLANIASLPGIVKKAIAMSDVHLGYGFPIGGVAAFDPKSGVISPGGVGYDINCGVRLLLVNLDMEEFMGKREQILSEIYRNVPSGVGEESEFKIGPEDLNNLLDNGSEWALSKGFATKDDLDRTEDYGRIDGADHSKISQRAKSRGKNQLGTVGAGNHFIEIQKVEEIFDERVSKAMGLKKGSVVVMLHTGSRGLGHQVASDYIQMMEKEYGIDGLPDRELIYAPIESELGKDYRAAMAAAANFAFVNRQLITHQIRKSFAKFFPEAKLDLLYDVAHNIAKFEQFVIDGKEVTLCVHRKGATRSFGPGRLELPEKYRGIGQPILIPGSMGTFSYVLVGTETARSVSFASTAHGAGRVLSRSYATRNLSLESVNADLKQKDILIKAGSRKGILEEAPEAYKDINEVVRVSDSLGIGKIVAKLKPLAVVKG